MPPYFDQRFEDTTVIRLYIVGSVFLLVTLIDYLGGFVFYPLQNSITLLSEQRRKGLEKSRLEKVTDSRKGNAYSAMFNIADG